MKQIIPLVTVIISLFNQTTANPLKNEEGKNLVFTENKGQVADQNYQPRPDVLYSGSDGQISFYIRNNGISYQLNKVLKWQEIENFKTKEKRIRPESQSVYRIDVNWLNTNLAFSQATDETLIGYNNFYFRQCPEGVLKVQSYKGVTIQNIYQNINVHYYEKNGQLKCDYIVAPNTDYKQVQLKIEGASVIENIDGSLILQTPLGSVQEGKPIAYQNGNKLNARWRIKNNILSFEIDNYNPEYELIIDPLTRLWGTYYGGVGYDSGNALCTDGSGNTYMAGTTSNSSGTTIATTGAHQATLTSSVYSGFLAKFNSSGVRLWGTYYGFGNEEGYDCSCDVSGNVFLCGRTGIMNGAGNSIATNGAHQSTIGGNYDAFLVKFDSNGIRLWGTYYGGINDDYGYTCSTDLSGNLYMAGLTASSSGTVIASNGAYQATYGGGSYDAFLVKFNSNGIRQWGTYYGGVGDDLGYGNCVDASGNSYLAGASSSSLGNAISSSGAHQINYGGGAKDGFLVKFNSNGLRQWGTFYGDIGTEIGFSCSTDPLGNIYLAGSAGSSLTGTAIATSGAQQTVSSASAPDAFLAKFNPAGVRQWGTFYGGSGQDIGFDVCNDLQGNAYLAGHTQCNTGNSIATIGGFQTSYGGGNTDAFLVKFNAVGVRQWGTYYGGTTSDVAHGCITDFSDRVYLTGITNSSSGMIVGSSGAHQATLAGISDAFLVKFDCPIINPVVISDSVLCSGGNINFTTIASSTLNYNWSGPNSFTSNLQNPSIINAQLLYSGNYSLTVDDGMGCSTTSVKTIVIKALPIIVVKPNKTLICAGDHISLTATGASSYTWSTNSTGSVIAVVPTINTSYTVMGTSINGCENKAVITVSVNSCLGISNEYEDHQTKIFPNPFTNKLSIEVEETADVQIIDLSGRIVTTTKIQKGVNNINTSILKSGLYIVQCSSGGNVSRFRVVKAE